ncbi:MAG: ATP-dependent DNA helicase RecG [Aggregatilineales bacterium]
MPSALETLIKILKLEREQGCENRAVIGGLSAYSTTWQQDAIQQARRPEHHILAEELSVLLVSYDSINGQTARIKQIDYMLKRITGRIPPPAEYKQKLDALREQKKKNEPPPQKRDERKSPKKPKPQKDKRRGKNSQGRSNRRRDNRNAYDDEPVLQMDDDYETGNSYGNTEPDIPLMPPLKRPPREPRTNFDPATAQDTLTRMQDTVMQIKGIGNGVARKLEKLDIHTIDDMLSYLPRRYDDYTQLAYIKQLEPGSIVTVIGTIEFAQERVGKNGRRDFYIKINDGSGSLDVSFFGQHFLKRQLYRGKQIVLSGKVTVFRDTLQMSNPEWEFVDVENLHTVGIVPVYPLTQGVTAKFFRRTMKNAVDQWAHKVPDHIPEDVLERCDLADLGWAIAHLHFPAGFDHLDHARRRYVFDKLLILQLGILRNRRDWQSVPGQPLEVDDAFVETFLKDAFPYTLTGAQQRVLADIRRDIAKDIPMNRLIQGDVGSGKTAIALAAMAMALQNGKQTALMAPTSILAEQHYRGFQQIFDSQPADLKPVIALLTGSLTTSERQSIYRGINDGSIDMVIGTHALIQDGVEFKDAGLVIIDEQHRFGVEQRGALRGKGINPHLLVMTATPIPRTLALTMYADLDLSIIDEKPPGRHPIDTRILRPAQRETAFEFIEEQITQGRQAFIIHPLVEASDKVETRSAVEAYEELTGVFHRHRVCLLHGRMSPTEKDEIMGAFANHEYDVMVTTSVAEVGVDVPNASVIMIEGANRFGLAQLHQFRGRVGRGSHQSYCLLMPDIDYPEDATEDMPIEALPEAFQRLKAMENSDDGFVLAELDWRMRGAGDLLGTRQSGSHILQLAEEMTPELVALAQREALTIYEKDAYLEQDEHALLAAQVRLLDNDEMDVS